MTDNTTNPELSDQDEVDVKSLGIDPEEPLRTLLEIWSNVTGNIEGSQAERITPSYANQVVSRWPLLKIQDVPRYNELYHEYLLDLRGILEREIATDPQALKRTESEGEWSDVEGNRPHYINLLRDWQVRIGDWEFEWDAAEADAHVRLAAIADAGAFFVGSTGLVEHLSTVAFPFTEEDRVDLTAALEAAQEARK